MSIKFPVSNFGNRKIGKGQPTFIIAELSCNHLGDFDLAVDTIKAMKNAGADCVKLQTSKPESITIDCKKKPFIIKGGTLWDNMTLFELYSKTYTPWEWHAELKQLANNLGMEFFSSPFDFEAVDFLESLNVPAYKIASFEITDIPLITYVATKQKPIIISTGIADEMDIQEAINACKKAGNDDIILLKCSSAYPTPLNEVNLNSMATIRSNFNTKVGLSDHTVGALIPIAAVTLGACIVEKHFILDKNLNSPDAAFSMTPEEFKTMVGEIRNVEKALGSSEIKISEKVEKNRQFARSLFVVKDIMKGEKLTTSNVKSIRPGYGMHPKYYEFILGEIANRDIERGTPLSRNLIDANND